MPDAPNPPQSHGGPDHRMTIGEFAARTRLTQKALRLYEIHGLLQPAIVDGRSRYRFYSADQLPRARRIAMLRWVGLPLATIASIIDVDNGDAGDALRAYWAEVEAGHKARANLVSHLINVWKEGPMPTYSIQTRDVAEAKVLTVSRKLRAPELPAFIPETCMRVFAQIDKQGATPTGAPSVLYHEPCDAETAGLVEVMVPFEGSMEPVDDFVIRIEGSHSEAYATITKEQVVFPTILQAYEAVGQWLDDNDVAMAGAPREVYFDPRPWDDLAPKDPAADIAFPFAR